MKTCERRQCVRCDEVVEVQYRYSARMRKLMKLYLLIPIGLIPLYPFAASDWVVSLPLMMLYMLGIGPVLSIVKDPPTCVTCGALVPKNPRDPVLTTS